MKKILLLCILIAAIASPAQQTVKKDSGTITVSGAAVGVAGGAFQLNNDLGMVTNGFEVVITGTPSTVSVVIKGCMRGTTCDTLDTYTTVANSNRKPTISVAYDYFEISASWTGGSSPTVRVNRTATLARSGGGGGTGAVSSVFGQIGIVPDLSGDVSTSGSSATTLAASGVSGTACGDTTHSCGLTYDAKGRITAATNNVIAGGSGTVTHTAGALTAGQIATGNGGADMTVGNLSGDVTTSGGTTTTLANIPSGVTVAGSMIRTNIAAPSSPAAGKNTTYTDSTDLRLHDKNASGVIGTTVVADTGSANNFLTAISAAGTISKAQPACGSLSNAAASCSTDTTVATNIATGTLNAARLPAVAVQTGQANTYTTGAQDFGSATSLKVPTSAGAAPTANGLVAYDSTANVYQAGINGVKKTIATTDVAVSQTGTSGGIPYYSSATTTASSAALTNNAAVFGGGVAAAPKVDTSITTDGSGNESVVSLTATGTGASATVYTNGSAQGHATANTITVEAPATVTTAYETLLPAGASSGVRHWSNTANVVTESTSGDAGHSVTVTIGSGTSIAATSLCSTTNCPAGTYHVSIYIDITTPCATTGTYIAWLGYTDDAVARTGSSVTTFFPIAGTGATTSTGSLALASTNNFGQADYIVRTTGAATGGLGSINYGTTATACGSGGPMVGKMYINVVQVG